MYNDQHDPNAEKHLLLDGGRAEHSQDNVVAALLTVANSGGGRVFMAPDYAVFATDTGELGNTFVYTDADNFVKMLEAKG